MLKWFNDYLSERKQRVINEGFKSTWESTLAGVPQGSVLGPFLFLLYINDIVKNIKTNIRLFADDTSLFVVIENEESVKLLNEDFITIANWADDWLVILHPNKTNTFLVSRKREPSNTEIVFNNVALKDESTQTHLGLTFASDATWGDQINKIYEKAA